LVNPLQPFAVRLVVREGVVQLVDPDLMARHVPDIDHVLLGIVGVGGRILPLYLAFFLS
jgi:hypothetical protein